MHSLPHQHHSSERCIFIVSELSLEVILIFGPLEGRCFIPLTSVKIIFSVWVSVIWNDNPKYSLAFILLGVHWASWICGLVSDINLEKFSVYYCFKYYFCSFFIFSLFGFPLCLWYIFYYYSIVLGYSDYFLVFVLFALQFLGILWIYPPAQRFSAQPCPATNKLIKDIIAVIVLLLFIISSIHWNTDFSSYNIHLILHAGYCIK